MKGFIIGLTATLITCAASPSAFAQIIITDGEIDRGLRYRNTTSWDGRPVTQRYADSIGPYFLFGGSSAQMHYLDYLDRYDRARKFGYPIPSDPFFPEPIAPPELVTPESTIVQPAPRIFHFRRFR